MTKKPTVIDLSHYQTHVDLKAAMGDGVLGVIHKATEGVSWTDQAYPGRKAECEQRGLAFAPYHFLKAGNISGQIAHFIDYAEPPHGGRVFIDYEDNGLTLDDLKKAIAAIEALDASLQIGIYGGSLLKEQIGGSVDNTLAAYPLWLAQYTTGTPSWPKGTWPVWSLWQFTDKADVAGIGACDGSVFNGSNEGLLKFLNPVPQHAVEPVDDTARLDITLPLHQAVDVYVNGHLVGRFA